MDARRAGQGENLARGLQQRNQLGTVPSNYANDKKPPIRFMKTIKDKIKLDLGTGERSESERIAKGGMAGLFLGEGGLSK